MDLLKQTQAYQRLSSLGKIVLLCGKLNVCDIQEKIKIYEKDFKYYNKRKPGYNRYGLSLTSKDGNFSGSPDLDSLKEYNKENNTNLKERDFREWTSLFKECEKLQIIMEPFYKHIGRSHILRLNRGGFFPPHRDDIGSVPQSFRLFISLSDPEHFVFLLDNEVMFFYPGKLYFINTHLNHCIFSFHDKNDFIIFNIDLSEESAKAVINKLSVS